MAVEFNAKEADKFGHTVARVMHRTNEPICRVSARRGSCDARMRHDRIGDLALTTLQYGNAVEIATDPLVDFYCLHLPLAGGFRARCLGPELAIGADTAHILNPPERGWMGWDASCRVLVVRLERALLDAQRRAAGQRALASELPESFSLTTPQGASFRRWLEFMHGETTQPASLLASVGAHQAEQMFFAVLFAALEPESAPLRSEIAPFYVKRAEDFIDAHLDDNIGLVDIVAASGVGMRTLYYGFRRRHGLAPMAWLKQRRLECVRAELTAADPATTSVTQVALRWRFWHLGRFARNYQTRFGESPSQTLKNRRRYL